MYSLREMPWSREVSRWLKGTKDFFDTFEFRLTFRHVSALDQFFGFSEDRLDVLTWCFYVEPDVALVDVGSNPLLQCFELWWLRKITNSHRFSAIQTSLYETHSLHRRTDIAVDREYPSTRTAPLVRAKAR